MEGKGCIGQGMDGEYRERMGKREGEGGAGKGWDGMVTNSSGNTRN